MGVRLNTTNINILTHTNEMQKQFLFTFKIKNKSQ